jgi:hypothetical protein
MKQIFNSKKIKAFGLGMVLASMIFAGIFMQSCSRDDILEDIATDTNIISQTRGSEDLNWEDQLESIMNTPPDILVNSKIELLGYEIISDNIDNSIDENNYKNAIKSDENMIPFYSDDFKSVKGITKKEITLRSSQHQKFTPEEGDNFLDEIELQGAKILRLKWNNNGIETNTICAVSDKEGIVYDNFITNFLVIKEPIIVNSQDGKIDSTIANTTPRLKSGSENTNFTGTVLWSISDTALWLWGSERGEVVITHTGYYSSGSFSYHNFNATHYMSIGNSGAIVSQISSNTIAYGYGMSTPYISITITFSGQNYSVQFSTMIGSTIGGSGQHTHPLRK